MSAVTAAAAAVSAAGFGIGAANALGAAFLSLVDIESRAAQNSDQNRNDQKINHTYFFPLRAYSAFSFLSELVHR